MRRTLALTLAVFCVGIALAKGPGVEPPSEGKAVVYFMRPTKIGMARPFHFFDGDKYINRMKGKNYFRYETEPGEHHFWAAAENRSHIKADLEAGRVYALLARVQFGIGSARVYLEPISPDSEMWARCLKLVNRKAPSQPDPAYIEKWLAKKPDYTRIELEKWTKAGEPGTILGPEDFIE